MKPDELRLRVAHILHRVVSMQNRINLKENLDGIEIGTLHDEIYSLLEKPKL